MFPIQSSPTTASATSTKRAAGLPTVWNLRTRLERPSWARFQEALAPRPVRDRAEHRGRDCRAPLRRAVTDREVRDDRRNQGEREPGVGPLFHPRGHWREQRDDPGELRPRDPDTEVRGEPEMSEPKFEERGCGRNAAFERPVRMPYSTALTLPALRRSTRLAKYGGPRAGVRFGTSVGSPLACRYSPFGDLEARRRRSSARSRARAAPSFRSTTGTSARPTQMCSLEQLRRRPIAASARALGHVQRVPGPKLHRRGRREPSMCLTSR